MHWSIISYLESHIAICNKMLLLSSYVVILLLLVSTYRSLNQMSYLKNSNFSLEKILFLLFY